MNNLLDMTRLESGTLRLQTGMARRWRNWWAPRSRAWAARARAGPSRSRCPPDLPLVPVDGVLIEQLLVNLLDNAFKYTPAEARVRVQASAADRAVTVEVVGRGTGAARRATEEQVFDKFYRGPSGERGFGLGLPICRAIVTAHGGRDLGREPASRAASRSASRCPWATQPAPSVEEARGS